MRTLDDNKRKAILKAGMDVIAEDGFHAAKIAKIAERAGVAIGSIYRYYPNKESIIVVILDQLWEKLAREMCMLTLRSDISVVEKLDRTVDLVFDIFTGNTALALIFVNENHRFLSKGAGTLKNNYDTFLDLAEDIIHEGVGQHIFNADVDIKIFRHFIIGAFRHLLQQWTLDSESISLNSVRHNLKFVIKHGILYHPVAKK